MPSKATLAAVAVCAALAAIASATDTSPHSKADRVFVGGRVWTGDKAKPVAEAIAVRGTKIIAVGTNAEIARLSGKPTESVNLKGRWVFPGFNDSHLHFLVTEKADLVDSGGLAEMQRRVMEFARRHPESPWVLGRGWGYAEFPGNNPHRRYLDAVVADRPVWMTDRDGHAAWCNSRALQIADITRKTPDPPNGVIVRDENGEPTGLLKEGAAMNLVRQYIPPANDEELHRTLKALLDRAASYGLTSVQNASFSFDEVPVFQRVIDEKALKVRFYWALLFDKEQNEDELARYKEVRKRMEGPAFKFGAAKGMVDGTVGSRTAALFDPYVGGGTGLPFWTQADLNAAVARYDREGFQILLHAVGDKAIHMALDAYEAAARTNGFTGRRHRVEHAEVPRPDDIPRFRQLGVVASTQPMFANPDKTTLESFATLLGPDRASRADAFKVWDDAGVVQAFGSDWPGTSMEPLRQIYCAVTRQTADGAPPGGWYPQNRVSPEAALRHYTVDAAYASFEEGNKGTLVAGKVADFVVLSDNILEPPAERLLKAKVLLTVMGGQDTWRDPSF
ncbi:MAG: amidohydrolase [Vicinamibacteria bacterium]